MKLLGRRLLKLLRNAAYFGAAIVISALAVGLVDELAMMLGGDQVAGVADFHQTALVAVWLLQVGLVLVAGVFMFSEVLGIAWEESSTARRIVRGWLK